MLMTPLMQQIVQNDTHNALKCRVMHNETIIKDRFVTQRHADISTVKATGYLGK
jgi:hypothetical protein